jgi:hypothetical protein
VCGTTRRCNRGTHPNRAPCRGRLQQTRPAAAEERYTLQDGRAPASRTRRAHCVRRRPEVQQRPPRTPAQFSRLDSEGTPRRPTLVRSAPTPALAAMRPPCARRRCARGPVREAHRASAAMAAWRRGARRNARRCPHLSESERVRAPGVDDMARMARPSPGDDVAPGVAPRPCVTVMHLDHEPVPGADVGGVSPVPCADVGGVSPVPVKMWEG